ncbi:hypothetical protein TNCV_4752971 [Trichonephila clavipes]|nr:hypothetical protein TNCV_4752971 [Trichonephila clavipes]
MNSTESAKRPSGKRPKKRKFTGNMHTRCKAVHSVDELLNNSASGKRFGCKKSQEASMQSAALEEVTLTNSSDIIISGDGTWKTRGYSSRVVVCAVIGDKTGKCIDAEV